MHHRLARTIVLILLLVFFRDQPLASPHPSSPQDQPAPSQQTGETDREEQEEETDTDVQDDDIDILLTDEGDIIYTEIDVTGTVIRETPIDSPNSVSVINRESLSQQGSPSVVELFKNMSVSGGVLGESNSWYNGTSTGIAETVANVNLRSLGASRTLVLLNGRRQTYLPARLAGGRFVDVNAFPDIAIDRIDVLKEGAGAR
ncbi:MAG: Plug domain-containing protein [Acidobacteriota bacterium]|nr:Plug domain-containing protein [Acidobacteriota bacterium]